jgi:transposase
LKVIREKCSQALHILDRFRIVAKMNKALDEVRAAEAREMARAGHEPLLKKSRWCVLKRKDNLTPQGCSFPAPALADVRSLHRKSQACCCALQQVVSAG